MIAPLTSGRTHAAIIVGDGNRVIALVSQTELLANLFIATERNERAAKASKTMLATLNGPVAVPASRMAQPVATVMGEVGWTWMTASQALQILQDKGFTNIGTLTRDAHGIWRAKAIKDDFALRVAVDVFSNLETQPESHGGLAQATPSE